jgi:adenosine deaminase
MECSLVGEFEMVADAAGLDAAGIAAVTRNAIAASFCDDTTKASLTTAVDGWTAEVAT